MTKEKFELFLGCFGNGITVYNKAAEENGDYKKIAHIADLTIKECCSSVSPFSHCKICEKMI